MPEYLVTITSELTGPVDDGALDRLVSGRGDADMSLDDDEFSMSETNVANRAGDALSVVMSKYLEVLRIADAPVGAIVAIEVVEWSRYLRAFEES